MILFSRGIWMDFRCKRLKYPARYGMQPHIMPMLSSIILNLLDIQTIIASAQHLHQTAHRHFEPRKVTMASEEDSIIQAYCARSTRPIYLFSTNTSCVLIGGTHSSPVMKIAQTPTFFRKGSCSFTTTGIGIIRI